MKKANLISKLNVINRFIIAFFLLTGPLAVAHAACCAGHGGVASCNKSTGHQMCKDGTVSPTCTCTKSKKATQTTTKSKTATTTPATTSTTKPKKSWWGGKSTTSPSTSNTSTTNTQKTTGGTSAKGCCSRHGGVAQCNAASGHQMCKDGTQSPTCTCH